MDEKYYWLGFSVFPGVGPAKFKKLIDRFGTAENAWGSEQIIEVLGSKLNEKFKQFKKKFSIEQYRQQLKKKDVWFLILNDEAYPQLLKQIKKPPFVLYGRGNINVFYSSSEEQSQVPDGTWQSDDSRSNSSQNDSSRVARTIIPSVGVVGTRKTTQYGRDVTKIITAELVRAGCVIVSGLALGVDAIAHMTTLENKGKTIAVMGCGVDCCTPRENQNLYNSILQNGGAIISELPLGHQPTKGTFPSRNRIIAGLSQAVLVTEGAADSGALITADYAFKNNRKVFAVPGQITSQMAQGPLKLLQKGAKLVTSGQDILKELEISDKQKEISREVKKIRADTKEEQIILDLLANQSLHFDQIVRLSKLDSAKVGSILSMMEIKGIIKGSDGAFFIAS